MVTQAFCQKKINTGQCCKTPDILISSEWKQHILDGLSIWCWHSLSFWTLVIPDFSSRSKSVQYFLMFVYEHIGTLYGWVVFSILTMLPSSNTHPGLWPHVSYSDSCSPAEPWEPSWLQVFVIHSCSPAPLMSYRAKCHSAQTHKHDMNTYVEDVIVLPILHIPPCEWPI